MRGYSRLRSSSSAKPSDRDTYLFQDAESLAQILEAQEQKAIAAASASKSSSKSMEKKNNAGLGKHFMASIWKVASLREKLHRSQSSAGENFVSAKAISEEAENISELTDFQHNDLRRASPLTDPPTFSRIDAADHHSPAAADAQPPPSLLRSTSARDSSVKVSINEIGSVGAAVHRALSVREGRLKSVDRQNPESESVEKENKNKTTKCNEGAEQNEGLPQKSVEKTQSMRHSLIATDVEEEWMPARNSSYFGPISLQKGSIFGGFDGVNLSYTYSAIDGGARSLDCRFCGCAIESVVHGVKSGNAYADLCHSCYTLHKANAQLADSPKVIKKKGGLIKACHRILRLSKRNSFI